MQVDAGTLLGGFTKDEWEQTPEYSEGKQRCDRPAEWRRVQRGRPGSG